MEEGKWITLRDGRRIFLKPKPIVLNDTNVYMNDKIREKNKKLEFKNREGEWQYKRNGNGKVVGYKLDDRIEIRKELNLNFGGQDTYDNGLYVNGKYIMSAGSGYTIPYLKKLGGFYKDALDSGIKDPYVRYSERENEIYVKDRKTGNTLLLKFEDRKE